MRSSIGRPHLILIIYNYNRNSGVNVIASVIHNGLLMKPAMSSEFSLDRLVRCEAFTGFDFLEVAPGLAREGW